MMKLEPTIGSVSVEHVSIGNTDPVNSPAHYNQGGIECIEAITAMTSTMQGEAAYMAGNILKYLWRHEYKNGMEDLKKAQWYLNKLIEVYGDKHK